MSFFETDMQQNHECQLKTQLRDVEKQLKNKKMKMNTCVIKQN